MESEWTPRLRRPLTGAPAIGSCSGILGAGEPEEIFRA